MAKRDPRLPLHNDPKYFVSNDENHPDYKYKLREKGFYLDPTVRRVDLNTVPMNGTEFIIKSKMLEEAMGYKDAYKNEGMLEDLLELLEECGFKTESANKPESAKDH